MGEFLKLDSPAEALARLFQNLPPVEIQTETVDSINSLGRVTAGALIAPGDLPPFRRSAVDGYAVRAVDTHGASEGLPALLKIAGEIRMGELPAFSLASEQAGVIHTGGMLPQGADAVVMVENTQAARQGEIEVNKPAAAGENVIQAGEDVKKGEPVLHAGVKIGPAEIGGLMALGLTRLTVVKKPLIGIISSGDEVIPPEEQPKGSQVRDVNSFSLAALVEQTGGEAVRYGIAGDRFEDLTGLVGAALKECQGVVVTAGSSASVRDLTAEVLNYFGEPGVLVHGVNVKPGKPTILAVCMGKAVIGLPGNPVSALVIAREFLKPVIEFHLGIKPSAYKPCVRARLTTSLASQAGREDRVPVRLSWMGTDLLAEPIFFKSNLIFSLVRADGLIRIESDQTGLAEGEIVEVELLD